jgi:hypothetical protein
VPARDDSTPGAPAPAKARTLIDTESLELRDPEGEIIRRRQTHEVSALSGQTNPADGADVKRGLKDPNHQNPKRLLANSAARLNYTPEERETAGLELLRRVLAADETTLTDVRHQPNVGADAVDDHGRYYELKVHAGPVPDSVKLEDSQIERALTTSEFYLVVVGNVEDGNADPEVRIIHDPLHQLTPQPRGSVHVSGIHTADAARWTFTRSGATPDPSG